MMLDWQAPDHLANPPTSNVAHSISIHTNQDGVRIVVLDEFRAFGDEPEHYQVRIAETELAAVLSEFQALASRLAISPSDSRDTQSENRRRYPNAYAPWTQADDRRLLTRFRAGASMDELTLEFGRNPGAINSRLARLRAKTLQHGEVPDPGPAWY
jgi:hypothetical protein